MSQKTINNIPVSDETFNKMVFLQERLRRIEAESRLLVMEKAEAEKETKELIAEIEASAPKSPDGSLAQQVAAVTSPAVS